MDKQTSAVLKSEKVQFLILLDLPQLLKTMFLKFSFITSLFEFFLPKHVNFCLFALSFQIALFLQNCFQEM